MIEERNSEVCWRIHDKPNGVEHWRCYLL